MTRIKVLVVMVLAALLLVGVVGQVGAQDAGGGGGAGGGQGGGRGGFDPAQMRQRMVERMKEQLGASDEEWKIIQPRLEKVMAAQMESRMSAFGGMFGRRGRGGDNADQPQSAIAKATAELRTALENKDTPAEELKAKLAAVREARAKAQADLAAAQKDLKEVLTQRQEAQLVMSGTLD